MFNNQYKFEKVEFTICVFSKKFNDKGQDK